MNEQATIQGVNEPQFLYHYTGYPGLAGITSSKSLWCSQIQYLNDFEELSHGLEILKNTCMEYFSSEELVAGLEEITPRFEKVNIYVCSFTEEQDLLSQWRGYGKDAGVSIGFSREKLEQKSAQNQFTLARCIYDDEKISVTKKFVNQRVEDAGMNLDDENSAYSIASGFLHIAARFKNRCFIEENEWRLISTPTPSHHKSIGVRSNNNGLVPYFEFNLKTGLQPLKNDLQPWRTNEDICISSVMIGPHKEQTLQMSAVGTLFQTNDSFVKSVSRSQIPFRML